MITLVDAAVRETNAGRTGEYYGEAALRRGIPQCTVFSLSDRSGKIIEWFYGGGTYDPDIEEITVWKDYLRPMKTRTFSRQQIAHARYNRKHIEIMFGNGGWLYGSVVTKISPQNCDLPMLRFDDKRLISVHKGTAIVNMWKLDISFTERVWAFRKLDLPAVVCGYNDPLTVAYIIQNDIPKIGYWDIPKQEFILPPEKSWLVNLDIMR